MTFPIQKTDAEWKALLAEKRAEPGAFQVTRHAATERPYSGKYERVWADGSYHCICCGNKADGSYHCICCGNKLFDATTKFDAGCGWPSFSQAVPGAIKEIRDVSHGMVRTETVCAQCGAHLGHVFPDGPTDTGLRYCMNSASLDFQPEGKKT
jgi:peptide-methionine (R)-S-oxide reductase